MDAMKDFKYEPIRKLSDETDTPTTIEAQEATLEYLCARQKRRLRIAIVWASFTSVIAALSILYILLYSNNNRNGIHATDLASLRDYVKYEEILFDGAFKYNPDTGLVYRDFKNASGARYFGEPSQDMDDAWAELMRGELPLLTDEEAAPYLPELRKITKGPEDEGHFYFELDMFHSLHCLNALRQRLDHSYYTNTSHNPNITYPPNYEREHTDHCLDQLKQSVQCHGDLAPVPLYVWKGFPIALGRSERHTCRSFEKIRRWLDGRNGVWEPLATA